MLTSYENQNDIFTELEMLNVQVAIKDEIDFLRIRNKSVRAYTKARARYLATVFCKASGFVPHSNSNYETRKLHTHLLGLMCNIGLHRSYNINRIARYLCTELCEFPNIQNRVMSDNYFAFQKVEEGIIALEELDTVINSLHQ